MCVTNQTRKFFPLFAVLSTHENGGLDFMFSMGDGAKAITLAWSEVRAILRIVSINVYSKRNISTNQI